MIIGNELAGSALHGPNTPLVVHLIHRLAVGGLENGIVNLINNMPAERFRHAIICLTDSTDFRLRITRPGVPVICLNKRQGKDLPAYRRLWSLLRRLRPDILHTRTMAAFDGQVYGLLAGVPGRVHGEHGQVSSAMAAGGLKHRLLRYAMRPVIHRYTAVSMDLANYLVSGLGIPRWKVTQIYNGVDARLFHPRCGPREAVGPAGFIKEDSVVIGTVGRKQPVKDQACLVRAFLHLAGSSPALRSRLRLVLVGDGPLLEDLRSMISAAGAAELAWLPGERKDVPELLRALDVFVLPSLAEGTCNTILEAMATGLPVIATEVGVIPN